MADLKKQLEEKAEVKEKAEEVKANEQADQAIASDHAAAMSSPDDKHENATEQYSEKIIQVMQELHSKDYDYIPPQPFSIPPASAAAPPGVPAPISMTPLVTLSMGNAVGFSTSGATIYGGGGATGSDAAADIGPRDALQYSAAVINGTVGSDTIYAEGPLVGNSNPAISVGNYAKEFILQVAGYFTSLNDILISGLPSYVSIVGGTDNGDGTWTLPSSYASNGSTFKLVYDKDGWVPSGETPLT